MKQRARDAYLAKMRALGHKDIQYKPNSLTLMPSHAFLRASADGIIVNHRHHESPGVLEISAHTRWTVFQCTKKV